MFRSSKKGFGDAASALILFIAVLAISVGLVVAFQNFVVETQDSLEDQNDLTSNKLRTSLSITNIVYNSTSNNVSVYVKNIGQTQLTTEFIDLFVNGIFQTGFATLDASSPASTMSILNPQETLLIDYNIVLGSGSHEVRVSTEFGNTVEESFNIQ